MRTIVCRTAMVPFAATTDQREQLKNAPRHTQIAERELTDAMASQMSLGALVEYVVTSFLNALKRRLSSTAQPMMVALAKAIASGDAATAGRVMNAVATELDVDAPTLSGARQLAVGLAGTLPAFRQESIADERLREAARLCDEGGDLCMAIDAPDMAYNLFEASYMLASTIGESTLAVAAKLLETANPDKKDQYASAAWRFATERVRESLASRTEWLESLDAVELALSIAPAPDVALRRALFDQLLSVVLGARDAPVAAILPMLMAQAPPDTVEPAVRREFLKRLLDATHDQLSAAPDGAITHFGAIKGQALADDLRIELGAVPMLRPSLSWGDLSLSHRRLVQVVPLGRSLVADVDRTGGFALELVHEIGHAYCLLGPIGLAHTGLRSSLHYAEMTLHDLAGHRGSPDSWRNADPLPEIPAHAFSIWLAERQLRIAQRASVFRSVWTPWLEGVALYLELLCDPADSANEIVAPHAIVRGLVDFHVPPRREGESADAFATRFANECTREFEKFYSAALTRYSRLRHSAYAQSGDDTVVYLAGYLVVRALVSRWEHTLGRRLKAIDAVKLLLDATRNGTGDALPLLDAPLDEFRRQCVDGMTQWLSSLAVLERTSLEAFLKEVHSDDRKPPFTWMSGKPMPVTEATEGHLNKLVDDLLTGATAAIMGVEGEAAEARLADPRFVRHRQAIGELFGVNYQRMTLVPVGLDLARLLTFDDHARLAICPRTYAGLDGTHSDLRLQRYSIGSWVAPGGASEIRAIRDACARRRTGRAAVTRVVDMVGYPDSPLPSASASYVCCSLGSEWSHVTLGYFAKTLDGEYQAFRERILGRLDPLPFCRDEANNILSPTFLSNRLRRAGWSEEPQASWRSVQRTDMESAAFAICARAFGVAEDAIRVALQQSVSSAAARSELFGYLYESGFSRQPAPPRHGQNADVVRFTIDKLEPSGIKPAREYPWHN